MRSLYKPSYDDSLISPYKIWINEDLTETSIRTIKKHNVRLIKGKSEHSKNIVINTYGDIIAKDSKVLFKVFSEIIKDHEISDKMKITLFDKKLAFIVEKDDDLQFDGFLLSLEKEYEITPDSYLIYYPIYDEYLKRYERKQGGSRIILNFDIDFPSERALLVFAWWLSHEKKSDIETVIGPYYYKVDIYYSDFIITEEESSNNYYYF